MTDSWNKKILDYEIETISCRVRADFSTRPSWNKKILDYEIETADIVGQEAATRFFVEIKRFSITRLKLPGHWGVGYWGRCRWNKKILDYEIETRKNPHWKSNSRIVEIRRFSITRLKLACRILFPGIERIVEIRRFSITRLKLTIQAPQQRLPVKVEIRRFSITRLKQCPVRLRQVFLCRLK